MTDDEKRTLGALYLSRYKLGEDVFYYEDKDYGICEICIHAKLSGYVEPCYSCNKNCSFTIDLLQVYQNEKQGRVEFRANYND